MEACSAKYGVEQALREVLLSHAEVHWVKTSDGAEPTLPISASDLHEVLLILLRNAAEAMDAPGEASIETRSTGYATAATDRSPTIDDLCRIGRKHAAFRPAVIPGPESARMGSAPKFHRGLPVPPHSEGVMPWFRTVSPCPR